MIRMKCVSTVAVVLVFLVFAPTPSFLQQLPTALRIGSLFLEDDRGLHDTFRTAIDALKRRPDLIPSTRVDFDIQYANPGDHFHLGKRACLEMQYGVMAIFGPFDNSLDSHLASVTSVLNMPLLSFAPGGPHGSLSISLYPSQYDLAAATKDALKFLKWPEIGVLLDDNGPLSSSELLETIGSLDSSLVPIQAGDELRVSLAELRDRKVYHIIVNVAAQRTEEFIQAILGTGMVDEDYQYFFTSLDAHLANFEPLRFVKARFFSYRIKPNKDSPFYRLITRDSPGLLNSTTQLLAVDALELFARGIRLAADKGSDMATPPRVSCSGEQTWNAGLALHSALQQVKFRGVSGLVSFDDGTRTSVDLDLLRLSVHSNNNTFDRLGVWSIRPEEDAGTLNTTGGFSQSFNKSTIIVSTVLDIPYCQQDDSGEYKGFIPEMLSELERTLGVSFQIKEVADRRYGTYVARTKSWNGIVGEVMQGKADIGFAALTVTAERERAVDFTTPFMEAELTILYRTLQIEPVAFGWLLSPLSWPLWLALIVSYAVVSVFLYLVGAISPYQRQVAPGSGRCCGSGLSLANSFWVTTSSLFLRGTDVPIVATSARLIVSAWWFFSLGVVLILIVLEVFMFSTGSGFAPLVPDFLGHSGTALVGVLRGGSSFRLLQTRQDLLPLLQRAESSGHTGFPKTIGEGIDSVLNGDLEGFIIESPTADLAKASHCNLRTIPQILDKRVFAIAVQHGSSLRDDISVGLLKLRENGKLDLLKNRWWPKGHCRDNELTHLSPASLEAYYMLFVVLFSTLFFALLVALAERIFHRRVFSAKLRTSDLPESDK